MDNEARQQLRRTLKWALRADPWRSTESKGITKDWYDKKLDALLAYSLVKDNMPRRTLKIMRLHFCQGIPLDKIAFDLCLSIRQVIRDVNKGLDLIIDNTPQGIIVSLNPARFQWILRGCQHCGGDLYWDEEGAHGEDGEYCCIQCATRYTVRELEDLQLIKK